jgi:hypothetical protein
MGSIAKIAERCFNAVIRRAFRLKRRFPHLLRQQDTRKWNVPEEFPSTECGFVDRVWQFGKAGEVPHGRFVRLFADGRVGGYLRRRAAHWECTGTALRLLDARGNVTILFDRAARDGAAGLRVTGGTARASGGRCFLEEHRPPQPLSPYPVALDWRIDPEHERRRHLVLIGADERATHVRWPRDIAAGERDWDLGVIFYGQVANYPPPDDCAFSVYIPKSSKFQSLYQVLHAGSRLWQYERIWLPDDDIMISWRDIKRMFSICDRFRLVLAQPALTAESYVGHRITRRRRGSLLRFVRFVEGMAPVFTRDALRVVAPTFAGASAGWGLDHVWPKLLGEPPEGLAIIDAVAMTHTRPVAARYGVVGALLEMNRLMESFGVAEDFTELAGISDEDGRGRGAECVPQGATVGRPVVHWTRDPPRISR